MDTVLEILKTPLNTILVLAGLALVFLSFFEISKGTVRLRKSTAKNSWVPAAIGAVLILGGLFYKSGGASPVAQPTLVPIALTETVPTATTASTDTPLPTATVTAPATETVMPPTLTASPIPVKALSDNCIDRRTWNVDSIDLDALTAIPDNGTCLNINNFGMTVSGGILRVVVASSNTKKASGIYTDVNDQAVIKFNVTVQQIYTPTTGDPAYVTFSIARQNEQMTRTKTGRFKLEVDEHSNNATAFFYLADPDEPNGIKLLSQHPIFRRSYDIRLELHGLSMDVYINNIKLKETINIPGGPNVFYIGYNVPAGGGATIDIKALNIDGVNK